MTKDRVLETDDFLFSKTGCDVGGGRDREVRDGAEPAERFERAREPEGREGREKVTQRKRQKKQHTDSNDRQTDRLSAPRQCQIVTVPQHWWPCHCRLLMM